MNNLQAMVYNQKQQLQKTNMEIEKVTTSIKRQMHIYDKCDAELSDKLEWLLEFKSGIEKALRQTEADLKEVIS